MKEALKKAGWRVYLQILSSLILLFLLYSLGTPLYLVLLFGVFILFLVFLKGKLYTKIDHYLTKRFTFISKLSPLAKKFVIVIIFMIIYLILKQVIYSGLKVFGVDIQKTLFDSINQSVK